MPWDRRAPTAALYRSRQYQRDRAALIAAFKPGQPCCLCGHPITTARYVEAQHQPGTTILVGLAHGTKNRCPTCGKRCNQVDAAIRVNRARAARQQNGRVTQLQW
jgi:hypothetical protein